MFGKKVLSATLMVVTLFVVGCGSSDSSYTSTPPTGYLIDSAVGGVDYSCGNTNGVTTSDGGFTCSVMPVKFSVGALVLGSINSVASDGKVFPQDLAGVSRDNFTDENVLKIASLVQSLDSDGDHSNGITIETSTKAKFTKSQDIKNMSITDVESDVKSAGKEFIEPSVAVGHLEKTMSTEADTSVDKPTPSSSPVVKPSFTLKDFSTSMIGGGYQKASISSSKVSSATIVLSLRDNNITTISSQVCTTSSCEFTITTNELNSTEGPYYYDLYAEVSGVKYIASKITLSSGTAPRKVNIINQCSYDVFASYTGGNAATIACSPSTTTPAKGSCNEGYICYQPSNTTRYCVPGTTTTDKIISNFSDIDINASKCASNTTDTNTSSATLGQCTCSTDSDCASNQACNLTSSPKQCYFAMNFANKGRVNAKSNMLFDVALEDFSVKTNLGNSFSLGFNTGCKDDNLSNCVTSKDDSTPSTVFEITMGTDGMDYYDVSYINGINAPTSVKPVARPELEDSNKSDLYQCGVAAGTGYEITKLGKAPGMDIHGCKYDYETIFASNSGFNYVDYNSSSAVCNSDSDCGSLICGYSFDAIQNGYTNKTCGNRIGYWTYAQICSVNSKYDNKAMDINCSDPKKLSYSLCKDDGDINASKSCYNSNQVKAGDDCCGYSVWSFDSVEVPATMEAIGKASTVWIDNIQPKVQMLKQGCPSAYSYQFDDPTSTFTCKNKKNSTINYEVTLCPSTAPNTTASAGINPASSGKPAKLSKIVSVTYDENSSDYIFDTSLNLPTTTDSYFLITNNTALSMSNLVQYNAEQNSNYLFNSSNKSSKLLIPNVSYSKQSSQSMQICSCSGNKCPTNSNDYNISKATCDTPYSIDPTFIARKISIIGTPLSATTDGNESIITVSWSVPDTQSLSAKYFILTNADKNSTSTLFQFNEQKITTYPFSYDTSSAKLYIDNYDSAVSPAMVQVCTCSTDAADNYTCPSASNGYNTAVPCSQLINVTAK